MVVPQWAVPQWVVPLWVVPQLVVPRWVVLLGEAAKKEAVAGAARAEVEEEAVAEAARVEVEEEEAAVRGGEKKAAVVVVWLAVQTRFGR